MSISEAIDLVCKSMELDIDILTCPNKCKQTKRYFEGRMVVTYIMRKQKQPMYFERIAFHLGRLYPNGKGDHAVTIRYYRIVQDLIFVNDKRFTKKLFPILAEAGIDANRPTYITRN